MHCRRFSVCFATRGLLDEHMCRCEFTSSLTLTSLSYRLRLSCCETVIRLLTSTKLLCPETLLQRTTFTQHIQPRALTLIKSTMKKVHNSYVIMVSKTTIFIHCIQCPNKSDSQFPHLIHVGLLKFSILTYFNIETHTIPNGQQKQLMDILKNIYFSLPPTNRFFEAIAIHKIVPHHKKMVQTRHLKKTVVISTCKGRE